MTLDELRGKARLTKEQIQDALKTEPRGEGDTYFRRTSDAARDKAIAVMMEEFQEVAAAGNNLVNWLYEQGLGGEYRAILGQALGAHATLQEEINND